MDFEESAQPSYAQAIAEMEPLPTARRRRPVLWGTSVLVVVVVVATLALSTSGTDFSSTSPRVVLSRAQSRTTGSGTAHMSGTDSLSLDDRTSKLLDISGDGNFADKSLTLTMKVGGLTEQARVVDGVTYLSVSGVDLPGGAHWVSISAADLKLDPAATSSVGSQDPSSGLQFLSAVSGNPQIADHDQLDGVDVTHYRFTLDLKSFFARVGSAAKSLNASGLGASISKLGSLIDLSSIPGEAWIDAEGRVRRFEVTLGITELGQTVKSVDDFRFSKFDEPVAISAPPASDTVPFHDVPDFFGRIAKAAVSSAAQTG